MTQPKQLAPDLYESDSTDKTIQLGYLLGSVLKSGDAVILTGDLGAGKTQLTKGIAEALGITQAITSPTFTIQMVYDQGDLPLYHFDLYRVGSADELGDCGIWDVLGDDGVCIIEWGEQFRDELGDDLLECVISRQESPDGSEPARTIRFIAHNVEGQRIIQELDAAYTKAQAS